MLKAVPTVCIFLLLYFYLQSMLFKPLARVLKQRETLTAGARQAAEDAIAAAERKQQEYEKRFNEARAEVYRSQEEMRRQWLEQQSAQVAEAQKSAEDAVRKAKDQVAADAAAARDSLTSPSGELAEEIAQAVLARRARSAG